MADTGPTDPEVRRRMWTVVTTALGTSSKSMSRAAAEERAVGCGMQPALPVSVIDAVVHAVQ
jgi:hypothetical protein